MVQSRVVTQGFAVTIAKECGLKCYDDISVVLEAADNSGPRQPC
jgi:hypothetical protein